MRVGTDRALHDLGRIEVSNGVGIVPDMDCFDFAHNQLDLSGIDLAKFADGQVVPVLPILSVPQPVPAMIPELPKEDHRWVSAHSAKGNRSKRGPYHRSKERSAPFEALATKLGFPQLAAFDLALTKYKNINEAKGALAKSAALTGSETEFFEKEFKRCTDRMNHYGRL